ncbi:MAG TPA: hypothetical protein V6D47_07950 [Oscillatoriaceae cyanobacterium]
MNDFSDATAPTFRLPTPADIGALQEDVMRQVEEGAATLELIIPQSVPERLGATIGRVPPEPLANAPLAAQCWFDLMTVLAEFEGGATAKQLARRIGHERFAASLSRVLERLTQRGELVRTTKGAVRYQPKPPVKVLAPLLRQFPNRLPSAERDAFELAVLAYEEEPGAQEWQAMGLALRRLVSCLPGWPAAIAEDVDANPVEWLRLVAAVNPPAYRVEEEDPRLTALNAQVKRLAAENAALQARLDQATDEITALQARIAQLEAEDAETPEWWGDARSALEEFLDGRGRGALPEGLAEVDVARWRELVLATKANRKDLLAIAAGLGQLYDAPTGHQRLTTLSFKDHPFDSLWRMRVGHYRIVYGLTQNAPHPIVIGTRGEVYELTVHALRNRHW